MAHHDGQPRLEHDGRHSVVLKARQLICGGEGAKQGCTEGVRPRGRGERRRARRPEVAQSTGTRRCHPHTRSPPDTASGASRMLYHLMPNLPPPSRWMCFLIFSALKRAVYCSQANGGAS